MHAIISAFQDQSVGAACRQCDQYKAEIKIGTYQAEVIKKINETVGKNLLTDLVEKNGTGKADIWNVTVNMDPKLYEKIENDIINSLHWMGLKAKVDYTDACFTNSFEMTIEMDDEARSDQSKRKILASRGWAWNDLEKSSLQQRVRQAVIRQHKELSKEIFECMTNDRKSYFWTVSPSNPVSERVLKKIQDEAAEFKYKITPRFEEDELKLDIEAQKKD